MQVGQASVALLAAVGGALGLGMVRVLRFQTPRPCLSPFGAGVLQSGLAPAPLPERPGSLGRDSSRTVAGDDRRPRTRRSTAVPRAPPTAPRAPSSAQDSLGAP